MLRSTLLVLLVVFAGACGDRSLSPPPDDAGYRDGAVDGPYRPDSGTSGCAADTDCVVAVRTDNCCEAAYAELRSRVDADQCLELWSASWSTAPPQACLDRWDPQCAVIDCMPGPPPSRVARCAQGTCEFAPECVDPTDCAIAVDTRACCPCPTVVPARLLDEDRCLVKSPPTGPAPAGCAPQACPAMPCPSCPVTGQNCIAQTCESGVR